MRPRRFLRLSPDGLEKRRFAVGHRLAVWLMVLTTSMWSVAGLATRHLESARGFEVTFWRSFFTVLSLVGIFAISRGKRAFDEFRTGGAWLWLSGICWAVMFTAFMLALTMTSVANVLITMATGPLFTALIAWLVVGQKLRLRTWIAVLVAGLGIAYMYGAQLGEGSGLGTLIALCVPIAGSINWTVVNRSQANGAKVDLVPAVLIGAIVSSLVTLPFAYPFSASSRDLGILAGLGFFQLAVPCILAVYCAKALRAPEVALLALLEVIFGILLVWIGAGERPSAEVLAGGFVVVGALATNAILGWKDNT